MKTKVFTLLFGLFACAGIVLASGTLINGIWYELDEENLTATVTYSGSSYSENRDRYVGSLVIPSSVKYELHDYAVTAIGDFACMYCNNLTSVSIPGSVKSIGRYAFGNCSFVSLTIPDGVETIDEYAFYWCQQLKSLTISKSVKFIQSPALSGCHRLTQIVVDANNPYYDSRENCNAIIRTGENTLTHGCVASVIPASVHTIGCSAFEEITSMTSFTIPGTVERVDASAFSLCSKLETVVISEGVKSFGYCVFSHCPFKSLFFPKSVNHLDGILYAWCDNLEELKVDAENPVYDSRDNCNAVIESKTNRLVLGCKATLIPKSVTIIGERAFEICVGFPSVVLHEGLTTLEYRAFKGCTGMESIVLPSTLTTIGKEALNGCSKLTSITNYATTPQKIDETVLGGDPAWSCMPIDKKTCYLYVFKSAMDAYREAEEWKLFANIESIDLPEGIESVSTHPSTVSQKILREGQVLIVRGDHFYTVTGEEVKSF